MSYMVIFQSPEGNAGYNQFEKLEGAVEFVETLRNEQGVENARMFDLKEIEFVMTPTWHVDMAALGAGSPATEEPAAPEAPVDVAPPVVEEPSFEAPVVEEAAPPVDLTDVPAPTFEAPVVEEPLQAYEPPVAPEAPAAESFPPPPAPPADGGPSFLPPPPMPPNEDVAPPAPEAPEAPPAAEQPQRRGLFGR